MSGRRWDAEIDEDDRRCGEGADEDYVTLQVITTYSTGLTSTKKAFLE